VLWYGLNSSGPGQGPVASSCENGNEPLGFHKIVRNPRVAERLAASPEELSPTKFVGWLVGWLVSSLVN
jgi:hypothetical protein